MTGFKAPLDDIVFSLAHVAGAEGLSDWDGALAGDVLGHFGSFAETVIAPLNAVGDAQGARLENGRVRMPGGFPEAYVQLAEGGWQGLSAPERFGGSGLSPLISAGVSEIFSGANHSMQMVCNLVPGAIALLLEFGSQDQQERFVPKLASGDLLSTMCLTEADAGSDLSAIRCKAERVDGCWRVSGEKIFISGGDQDMSRGVLHLVLARSGAREEGIGGLSLFVCEAQPGIRVARLEEKLGLHASPTCQLVFDNASAELVGDAGAGLKAMFTLMNHARLDVALQGVAHASRAAQIASAYAEERVQGRKADGSPARLSDHADVRRMLDEQQCLALGARGMCHVALVELQKGDRPDLADFLTPLCKVFGSEAGIRAADLGIQVLGGYGYLEEYLIGQTWRDARITAIYEGANGIHERSIATRGLRNENAVAMFADLVRELADGDSQVLGWLTDWCRAKDQVLSAADPLPLAHAFAQATMAVFFAAVWQKICRVAAQNIAPDRISRLGERVPLIVRGRLAGLPLTEHPVAS